MSEQPLGQPARKEAGGELILPAAAVLFTIYYFTTILEVPWTAQVSAVLVGSVLIVLCVILAVRTFLGVRRGEQSLGLGTLIAPRAFIGKRLLLLGLTLGYIAVIAWLGFTLTTFVFLTAAMLVLGEGRRKGLILTLSAVLSIGGYLLFVVAFQTRYPEGPVEALFKAVF
jgi:hypothetical protein